MLAGREGCGLRLTEDVGVEGSGKRVEEANPVQDKAIPEVLAQTSGI